MSIRFGQSIRKLLLTYQYRHLEPQLINASYFLNSNRCKPQQLFFASITSTICENKNKNLIKKIYLLASGGPFFRKFINLKKIIRIIDCLKINAVCAQIKDFIGK